MFPPLHTTESDKRLGEWLAKRLARSLPIDNWHRTQLEQLSASLNAPKQIAR